LLFYFRFICSKYIKIFSYKPKALPIFYDPREGWQWSSLWTAFWLAIKAGKQPDAPEETGAAR
jgi:hypothetical protein